MALMPDGVRKKYRYPKTTIRVDGRRRAAHLHRLIMERHLGRKLGRFEVVHHKNHDPKDNRIENLEVMSLGDHTRLHCRGHSPAANATGAAVHRGSANGNAKLNDEKVKRMRAAYATGKTPAELGRQFNISRAVASKVVHGQCWKHVR
jgi:hypothetical protein